MNDICFILVDGITKPLTSSTNNDTSIVQSLLKRFPRSHCHSYDPFMGFRGLPAVWNDEDILEKLGQSLLENISVCPERSTAHQICHKVEEKGGPSLRGRNIVFLGHVLGGSIIKSALALANKISLYQPIAQATVAVVLSGDLHLADMPFLWERQVVMLLTISERGLGNQVGDTSTEQDHEGGIPLLVAAKESHSAIAGGLFDSFKPGHNRDFNNEKARGVLWNGSFALHKAVASSNDSLCRFLLRYGYEVNSVNTDHDAPIHIAAMNRARDMINFLVQHGANIKATNARGETALLLSAYAKDIDSAKLILKAAGPEQTKEFIDMPNIDHDTPLYASCCRQSEQMVQLLLDNGADPNQRCSEIRNTSLHEAVIRKNVEIIKLLLNAGADHNIRDELGLTAIDAAAEQGNADAIRLLIEKDPWTNIVNSNRSSALYYASQKGNLKCVQLLVEAGADLNARGENGLTPLHAAIESFRGKVIEYLLRLGADVNRNSELSKSPLQHAIEHFDSKIATLLINTNASTTVKVDQLSNLTEDAFLFAIKHPAAFILESPGETLQLAISKNYEEAAYFLMESDVDINETRGKYCTALQAAAASRAAINIMEKLLEKGAKVNIFGGSYGSALNAAISNDNQDAVSLLLKNDADPNIKHRGSLLIHHAVARDSVGIVKLILDRGINPNIMDEDGRPLLSYVTSTEVVDYLLSRPGVQIDETDLSLRTPLMEAVIRNRFDVMKCLLDNKADPNAQDSEGKTPLIRAVTASSPNLRIIEALLENGADPSLKDCRGRGALYWACLRLAGTQNTQVVDMLLRFLYKEGKLSLHGELAFHAVASLNADTIYVSRKEETFETLLHGRASVNLAERDGDGWTAYYTATRFGFTAITEPLSEGLIVEPYGWRSVELNEPTEWHRNDKAPCLTVSEDGYSVTVCEAPRNPDGLHKARATIRANHSMPGDKVYYFEITVEEDAHDQIIGVGFCEEQASLNMMVGCDPGSWGYHGSDGQSFAQSSQGSEYSNTYRKGDTIGCGVNFEKATAFFTLNGKLIGPVFYGIKGKLYPAVSFSTEQPRGKIKANFGQENFRYDAWELEINTEKTSTTAKTRRGDGRRQPKSTHNVEGDEASKQESEEDSDSEWTGSRAPRRG